MAAGVGNGETGWLSGETGGALVGVAVAGTGVAGYVAGQR